MGTLCSLELDRRDGNICQIKGIILFKYKGWRVSVSLYFSQYLSVFLSLLSSLPLSLSLSLSLSIYLSISLSGFGKFERKKKYL